MQICARTPKNEMRFCAQLESWLPWQRSYLISGDSKLTSFCSVSWGYKGFIFEVHSSINDQLFKWTQLNFFLHFVVLVLTLHLMITITKAHRLTSVTRKWFFKEKLTEYYCQKVCFSLRMWFSHCSLKSGIYLMYASTRNWSTAENVFVLLFMNCRRKKLVGRFHTSCQIRQNICRLHLSQDWINETDASNLL